MSGLGARIVWLAVIGIVALPAAAHAEIPTWSAPQEIAADAFAVDAGIDGDGAVTAVWNTARTVPTDPWYTYAAVRAPGESAFGAPVLVGERALGPQLEVNEAGAAAIAWTEERRDVCTRAPCPSSLRVRVRASGGAELGAAQTLAEDAYREPALDLNDRGEAVLAWTTMDGRVMASLRGRTGGFGPPATIAQSEDPAAHPFNQSVRPDLVTAAIGANGAAVIAWERLRAGGTPLLASYRPARGSFGPPEVASGAATANVPAAAVDARGTATLAYSTGNQAALAERPASGTWRTPRILGEGGHPRFTADAAGNRLAWWSSENVTIDGNSYRTVASARDRDGDWSDLYPILPSATFPSIELDGRGNAFALWVTPTARGQQAIGATLTRFGIQLANQELTRHQATIDGLDVNEAGAAVGVLTEYRNPGQAGSGGAVVLIVSRPSDRRPARARLTTRPGPRRVRAAIRCNEPCRATARLALRRRGAAAAARAPGRRVTAAAGRRARLAVRVTRRMRARIRRAGRVALVVRVEDAAGNVRTLRRRLPARRIARAR